MDTKKNKPETRNQIVYDDASFVKDLEARLMGLGLVDSQLIKAAEDWIVARKREFGVKQ